MSFLKSVTKHLTHAVEMPFHVTKDIIHGDFQGAIHDSFGQLDRDYKSLAKDLGIHGWVGQHPTAFAGMVAATILTAGGAAGAFGAGGGAAGVTAGTTAATTGGVTAAGVGAAETAAPISAAIGTSTAGVPITFSAADAAAAGAGSTWGSVGATAATNLIGSALGGGQQQQPHYAPQVQLAPVGRIQGGNGQQSYNLNPTQSDVIVPQFNVNAGQRFV